MNKILTLLLLLIVATSARALPFVPTTDPSSLSTRWYKLRTAGHYIYAQDNIYYRAVEASASDSSDDAYLWCFVGSASTGYKVYNKAFKEYLITNTLGNANSEWVAYYEPSGENDNDFYLISGSSPKLYIFFLEAFGHIATRTTKGTIFNAIAEFPDIPHITPTRYDEDGVGYAIVEGGDPLNTNEVAMNMCDNSTETKFTSRASNFYVVVQSNRPVAVKQYSLVTAKDSRSQYTRIPRSWKLQGSNDKINWTDLDVKKDYPMPLADRKEEIFYLNSAQKFFYFKLQMTDYVPDPSPMIQLSEFWINRQKHQWGNPSVYIAPTCGNPGTLQIKCNDCGVIVYSDINPSGTHNYLDGNCSMCGREEGETVILYNGQAVPYYADAMHGYRANDTWPSPPEGWNKVDFNASQFTSTIMPIANPGHTDGPSQSMIYNSLWYGEYNCYWFRRPFLLPEVESNVTYTLRYIHDDNVVIYINGRQVLNKEGWTAGAPQPTWANSYESVKISPTVLQQGRNVLAVYIQQNWGGAYFDCELVQQKGGSVPGDVTGDGKVDIDDINALINILTGKARSTDFPGNVDVSGDNKVDVEDINLLINIILGK